MSTPIPTTLTEFNAPAPPLPLPNVLIIPGNTQDQVIPFFDFRGRDIPPPPGVQKIYL